MSETPSSPDWDAPRETAGRNSWSLFDVIRTAAMICVLGLFALVIRRYSLMNPDLEGAGEAHPAVGKTLSTIALEPLTGGAKPVREEDLQGKVVLLNFWGTWCPPCREEFPHLAALAERYGSRPEFRFLSVSCGGGSSEDAEELRRETEAFLEEHGATLRTYHDPGAVTRQSVHDAAGFQGYPTTVLLDSERVIRGMWVGYYPGVEKEIDRAVAKLLP
ncbi:MAG: TlpA family protein disulfide reductase [Thermogutta sp.]|nr:TlpA family protein disulfide reductase [Thermogutta sp.]